MHNPRLDRDRLDRLHVAVRDAERIIARSMEMIEETQWLVRWACGLEHSLMGLHPPDC